MQIPKQIQLYGQTIHIEPDSGLQKRDCSGESLFNENKILLTTEVQKKDQIDQVYLHELMHFILLYATSHSPDKYKLKDGTDVYVCEELIDTVSHLLHQALTGGIGELNHKNWK